MGVLPQRSNKLDLVRYRLSCRLDIKTGGKEFDCTGPVKLLCCKLYFYTRLRAS